MSTNKMRNFYHFVKINYLSKLPLLECMKLIQIKWLSPSRKTPH